MPNKEPMVECPSCGGNGFDGFEEDTGCAFSCYRCGETGWVTKASADAEEAERGVYVANKAADAAAKRKAYGVPDGYGYYIDEVDGEVVLIPPRTAKPPVVDCFDDIPF